MQLLPSLLFELKAVCATFPDPRKGRGGNIAAADFGLSAFAMFFMQSASFLAYHLFLMIRHPPTSTPARSLFAYMTFFRYPTHFMGEAATLQPPISVCRRLL